MKPLLGVSVMLLSIGSAPAGDAAPDVLLEEALKTGTQLKTLLASVKDRETAEAAVPELTEVNKHLDAVQAKLSALEKKAPKEIDALMKKYAGELKALRRDLHREMDRVRKLPEAFAVLKDSPLFVAIDKARTDLARLQVGALSRSLAAYKLTNGDYPSRLEDLTKAERGGKPFVEKADLTDPWGRSFHYDVKERNPLTDEPLVWSEGPRPGEAGSAIRNWEKQKK
jgi:hypothetical protein